MKCFTKCSMPERLLSFNFFIHFRWAKRAYTLFYWQMKTFHFPHNAMTVKSLETVKEYMFVLKMRPPCLEKTSPKLSPKARSYCQWYTYYFIQFPIMFLFTERLRRVWQTTLCNALQYSLFNRRRFILKIAQQNCKIFKCPRCNKAFSALQILSVWAAVFSVTQKSKMVK